MRADSRHGSSRPDRTRGGAGAPAAPRAGGRRYVDTAELEALLAPVVRAAGLDLESVRVGTAGRRRLLRVIVDADSGVSLDDIALVSREVSARLDGTGAMGDAPYTLEVSSPGVDRPLTEPRHWRRAAGRLVRVPLAGPGPGAPGPGDPGDSPSPPAAGLAPEAAQAGQAGPGEPAGPIEGRVIAAGDSGVILEVGGTRREFGYAELGPGRVQVEFGRLADEPGDQDGAPAGAASGPQAGGRADGH
jgi:ribosome maturation factor RimP